MLDFLFVGRIYHTGKNNCGFHIDPQRLQNVVEVNMQH